MKKIITMLVAGMIISTSANSIVLADQTKAPDLNVDKSHMIVDKSRIVVEEMMLNVPKEKAVPVDLIKNCSGLAVIPGMFKGALFIGGSYGKGIVFKHNNGNWSGPAFISIGAGSLGLQLGGQTVDLILIVLGKKTMESFLKTKFKLGADIAAAVGPAGAQATAATEIFLNGGIYSYSKSKGVFIGLSLEGAAIATQAELNKAYYNATYSPADILAGKAYPPESAIKLINTLEKVRTAEFE
jgi:lipid-binding SYLF domain-containing protein